MTDDGASTNRPDAPAGAAPPVHPLDERFYVRGESEAYGPYDGRAIKDMIEQGRLLPNTGIARVGATEWTEIKDHPYFGALRRGGSAPVAAEAVRLPGAPGSYPESVHPPVRYAGFWIRLGAYLLDFVFIYIGIAVIFLVAGGAIGFNTQDDDARSILAGGVGFIALNAFVILYNVLFLRGTWQATPGKRLLGLHVVTTTGERLSGWRALGRYFAYILSALPLYIGFMMIGWNREKMGLHDMVCDTRVIYGKL